MASPAAARSSRPTLAVRRSTSRRCCGSRVSTAPAVRRRGCPRRTRCRHRSRAAFARRRAPRSHSPPWQSPSVSPSPARDRPRVVPWHLSVLDGCTFLYSAENGDVDAARLEGYFHYDVRHLSLWQLLVDGKPLEPLRSDPIDHFSARIVAAPDGSDPPVSVRRDRFIGDGFHEDIVLTNHTAKERRVHVEVCFGSDFADVLEAKQPGAQPI